MSGDWVGEKDSSRPTSKQGCKVVNRSHPPPPHRQNDGVDSGGGSQKHQLSVTEAALESRRLYRTFGLVTLFIEDTLLTFSEVYDRVNDALEAARTGTRSSRAEGKKSVAVGQDASSGNSRGVKLDHAKRSMGRRTVRLPLQLFCESVRKPPRSQLGPVEPCHMCELVGAKAHEIQPVPPGQDISLNHERYCQIMRVKGHQGSGQMHGWKVYVRVTTTKSVSRSWVTSELVRTLEDWLPGKTVKWLPCHVPLQRAHVGKTRHASVAKIPMVASAAQGEDEEEEEEEGKSAPALVPESPLSSVSVSSESDIAANSMLDVGSQVVVKAALEANARPQNPSIPIRIVSYNVNGIGKNMWAMKRLVFYNWLETHGFPELVLLQETHLNKYEELDVPGYSALVLPEDKLESGGRGLAILVKINSSLLVSRIQVPTHHNMHGTLREVAKRSGGGDEDEKAREAMPEIDEEAEESSDNDDAAADFSDGESDSSDSDTWGTDEDEPEGEEEHADILEVDDESEVAENKDHAVAIAVAHDSILAAPRQQQQQQQHQRRWHRAVREFVLAVEVQGTVLLPSQHPEDDTIQTQEHFTLAVVNTYIHPRHRRVGLEAMKNIIEALQHRQHYEHIVVVGDMNHPSARMARWCAKQKLAMSRIGDETITYKPKGRCRGTCIDHLLVSSHLFPCSSVQVMKDDEDPGISDHRPLLAMIQTSTIAKLVQQRREKHDEERQIVRLCMDEHDGKAGAVWEFVNDKRWTESGRLETTVIHHESDDAVSIRSLSLVLQENELDEVRGDEEKSLHEPQIRHAVCPAAYLVGQVYELAIEHGCTLQARREKRSSSYGNRVWLSRRASELLERRRKFVRDHENYTQVHASNTEELQRYLDMLQAWSGVENVDENAIDDLKIPEEIAGHSNRGRQRSVEVTIVTVHAAFKLCMAQMDRKIRQAVREAREKREKRALRRLTQLAYDSRGSRRAWSLIRKQCAEKPQWQLHQTQGIHASRDRKAMQVVSIRDERTGEVAQTPEAAGEIWRTHFGSVARDISGHSRSPEVWEERFRNLEQVVDESKFNSILNGMPTMDEVKRCVMKLCRNKAPGLDGVTSEVLQAAAKFEIFDKETNTSTASPLLVRILWLLQDCWRHEAIYESWREAEIVPIPKKGDLTRVNNYRGISLLPSLYKTLANICLERLNRLGNHTPLLSETQLGFRRHHGCLMQVGALFEVIERRRIKGQATHMCFVDLEKAYDSVPHEALKAKLWQLGIRGVLHSVLSALYDRPYASVRTGVEGMRCERFCVDRGLRQGDTLSPMLFNIYINDVLNGMEPIDVPCKRDGVDDVMQIAGLLFADDMVLFGESKEHLLGSMARLQEWLETNELKGNAAKCGYLVVEGMVDGRKVLTRAGEEGNEAKDGVVRGAAAAAAAAIAAAAAAAVPVAAPPAAAVLAENRKVQDYTTEDGLIVDGFGAVPRVREYIYLGVLITEDPTIQSMAKHTQRKLEKALAVYQPFLCRRTVPMVLKQMVIRNVLMPIAGWGAELWGRQQVLSEAMQRVINKAMRMALGVNAQTPVFAMLRLLQIKPVLQVAHEKIMRACHRWSTATVGPLPFFFESCNTTYQVVGYQPPMALMLRWYVRNGRGRPGVMPTTKHLKEMYEKMMQRRQEEGGLVLRRMQKLGFAPTNLFLVLAWRWPGSTRYLSYMAAVCTTGFRGCLGYVHGGMIHPKWKDTCPMCEEAGVREDLVHYMVKCRRWEVERDKCYDEEDKARWRQMLLLPGKNHIGTVNGSGRGANNSVDAATVAAARGGVGARALAIVAECAEDDDEAEQEDVAVGNGEEDGQQEVKHNNNDVVEAGEVGDLRENKSECGRGKEGRGPDTETMVCWEKVGVVDLAAVHNGRLTDKVHLRNFRTAAPRADGGASGVEASLRVLESTLRFVAATYPQRLRRLKQLRDEYKRSG